MRTVQKYPFPQLLKIKSEQDCLQQTNKQSPMQKQGLTFTTQFPLAKDRLRSQDQSPRQNRTIKSPNQKPLYFTKDIEPKPIYEILPVHIREFFKRKSDFMQIFNEYDSMNTHLNGLVDKIRSYRYEIGEEIQKISNIYQQIIEKILSQTIKHFERQQKKYSDQIEQNLQMIKNLENEKKDFEQKNKDLKTRYIIQESLYKINKLNSDSLQTELCLLHELLKNDVMGMIHHLGNLEQNQQALSIKENNPGELLTQDLAHFSSFIKQFEKEQETKSNVLGKMGGLITAMLQGSKQDAFTQVQDGELEWAAGKIALWEESSAFIESVYEAEASSVNYLKYQQLRKGTTANNQLMNLPNSDILKFKEQEIQVKHNNENWNLTINFIVFIENVIRNNETGRVMTWVSFKELIFQIYEERVQCQNEILSSLVTSSMPFDEFVCVYCLKKYKIRKIAENKLLEILVSLRFYIKSQPRAVYFALLCNIIKLQNQNESGKFDIFVQNFFFFCFQKVLNMKSQLIEHTENEYFTKEACLQLNDEIMSYLSESSRLKIYQKLQKVSFIQHNDQELFEVDKLLEMFIEEYFDLKKKNNRNLTKQFAKIYENDNGVFSIDDISNIIKDSSENNIFKQSSLTFPTQFTHARVFLRALTSTNNKFDVSPKEFLLASSKYGIDCPFPFIGIGQVQEIQQNNEQILKKYDFNPQDELKMDASIEKKEKLNKSPSQFKSVGNQSISGNAVVNEKINDSINNIPKEVEQTKYQIKIDSASSLFAQHFSLLREIRQYCKTFKESYQNERNQDVLWKEFGNILNVLEVGCQFLNFPINV